MYAPLHSIKLLVIRLSSSHRECHSDLDFLSKAQWLSWWVSRLSSRINDMLWVRILSFESAQSQIIKVGDLPCRQMCSECLGSIHKKHHKIDCLVQHCSISSALAMEILHLALTIEIWYQPIQVYLSPFTQIAIYQIVLIPSVPFGLGVVSMVRWLIR